MEIVLNGETREVRPAITLRELLRSLGLREDRVAIELNREIVHRDRWAETQLHDGDRLEIVQFVGGG
ncbi:MAG: sulfur carrier protein ThiS [Acidobacteria bacterium]|nr:sulfur carrier protein ThiS [Acidobacteriota bacterium]